VLNRHLARSVDDTVLNASPQVKAMIDSPSQDNGRKRHIAVDTIGLLLTVLVTAASVQDRDAARPLLWNLRKAFPSVRLALERLCRLSDRTRQAVRSAVRPEFRERDASAIQ
jgi:hypothetical protein